MLEQSKNLWANVTISGLDNVNPSLACVRPQIPKSSAYVQKCQSRFSSSWNTGFLADNSSGPCEMGSFPFSSLYSLYSGERDTQLSIDLWLHMKAYTGLQVLVMHFKVHASHLALLPSPLLHYASSQAVAVPSSLFPHTHSSSIKADFPPGPATLTVLFC